MFIVDVCIILLLENTGFIGIDNRLRLVHKTNGNISYWFRVNSTGHDLEYNRKNE